MRGLLALFNAGLECMFLDVPPPRRAVLRFESFLGFLGLTGVLALFNAG